MERSRPAPPSSLPCDLERQGDSSLSPEKLSRPQKRRRRADQQAVRKALVHTRSLHAALVDDNVGLRNVSSAPETDVHSKFNILESKLDQVLSIISSLWSCPQPEFIADMCANQTAEDETCVVLDYLNPNATEFVPAVEESISTYESDNPSSQCQASMSHILPSAQAVCELDDAAGETALDEKGNEGAGAGATEGFWCETELCETTQEHEREVGVFSNVNLADETFPLCLQDENGRRLTVDGLAQRVACGNEFDPGPLWQLVDEQTKKASEDMDEIGDLGIIELHHDIVSKVAIKLSKDGCLNSVTVPVLANLAAKLMVSVWIKHGLGKLPRTSETYEFVSDSLTDDIVEAAQDIETQLR